MPIRIGHSAEDEALDKLIKYIDDCELEKHDEEHVFLNDVLSDDDPRTKSTKAMEAVHKQME